MYSKFNIEIVYFERWMNESDSDRPWRSVKGGHKKNREEMKYSPVWVSLAKEVFLDNFILIVMENVGNHNDEVNDKIKES